jgi:uncharacterized delta-60 repeat protein
VALTLGSNASFGAVGQVVAGDDTLYLFGFAGVGVSMGIGVVHLTANGALLTSYGSGGLAMATSATFVPAYGALGSDGSIVIVGATSFGGPPVTARRFDANGGFDATFGGSGGLGLAGAGFQAVGLLREPNGDLVSVAEGPGGAFDVARFSPRGVLDAGFGSGSIVTLELPLAGVNVPGPLAAGLAIDQGGNILIGTAVVAQQGLSEQAVIARLSPNGTPDATWGPNGVQALDLSNGPSAVTALMFQPDGKLLVAGRAWTPTGSSDFAVARLTY